MNFYVQYVALCALLLGMPTMFLGFNKVVLIVELERKPLCCYKASNI